VGSDGDGATFSGGVGAVVVFAAVFGSAVGGLDGAEAPVLGTAGSVADFSFLSRLLNTPAAPLEAAPAAVAAWAAAAPYSTEACPAAVPSKATNPKTQLAANAIDRIGSTCLHQFAEISILAPGAYSV